MDASMLELAGGGLVAILIGMLTGIFGVGGGFLMTPALIILLHIPSTVAVGTGLGSFLANSSLGLAHRRRSSTLDVHLALVIGAGSLVGVMLGSWLLEYLNAVPNIVVNGREQQTVQFALMAAFFLLLGWIAVFMYADYHRTGGEPPARRVGSLSRVRIPPYGNFKTLEHPVMSLPALLVLGLTTGFLTGLLGIGGGVVLLPALIYLVGLRAQKAAGTSLLLVWIASLLAFVNNLVVGNVNGPLLAVLLAGGALGTRAGSRIGLRLSGPRLRLYFVFVLLAALLLVGVKLFALVFLAPPVEGV